MTTRRLGIVMHGVTGRMGMNQHLIRSIVAIRRDGGVILANGDRVMPDPILVGRNEDKLAALGKAHGVERISTDLDAALADPKDTVFFDAATTEIAYSSDVSLVGRLGKFGLGIMKKKAKETGEAFARALRARLEGAPVASDAG